MYSKQQIINFYKLNINQLRLIENFIDEITLFNKHTNIIGKSTLKYFWVRHVLDSLQICTHIANKKKSILDMGTGAGIPGLILAVCNFTDVSLVDSSSKKIEFIKNVCSKLR